MSSNLDQIVQDRLRALLEEIKKQESLSGHFGGETQSFDEEMEQIREYIEEAGEYAIAYECLVTNLEQVPFVVSGKAAVRLLEVGLVMGYKTEIDHDAMFDRR